MKCALLILLTAIAIAAPLILAAAARADEMVYVIEPGTKNCDTFRLGTWGDKQGAMAAGWLAGFVSGITEDEIPGDQRPWRSDFDIFITMVKAECKEHPDTLFHAAIVVLNRYRKKSP